jgi:hypothetical protein
VADTDLLFAALGPSSTDLVFGASLEDVRIDVSIVGTFAPLTVAVALCPPRDMDVVGAFAPLTVLSEVSYHTNTDRPIVGKVKALWQEANDTQQSTEQVFVEAVPYYAPVAQPFQDAQALSKFHAAVWADGVRTHTTQTAVFQDGVRAARSVQGKAQDGVKAQTSRRVVALDAVGFRYDRSARFQDGLRDRRNWTAAKFQDATRYSASLRTFGGHAAPLKLARSVRFQEGIRPPAGIRPVVVPPVVEPCYLPNPNLVFAELPGFGNLLFICERHPIEPPSGTVVVPIREVYVVLNEVSLRRVSPNTSLPTLNMSLSLDVDSYTWSMSASLPGSALADLAPTYPGEPVLLEANINGVAYRFLVNTIARERQFGQAGLRITARGLLSTLDAPFVPSMYFTNGQARTAQQLMGDVLTLNNIPLDWTVAWGLTNWNVPANAFSHTGSYISALNTIAQAAGGYIQPHPSLQTLYVKPRYPDGPWNWGALTADYSIPAAVATTESIEWLDKAVYNRVYVSGEANGVLGVITRDGTAGDLVAQMVTDPLITEGLAARQRGLSILSDTGLQANVTLKMPVLPETGILVPGHLIDYVDGGTTRRGIVRSTQVSIGGVANVWQSIGVETHV